MKKTLLAFCAAALMATGFASPAFSDPIRLNGAGATFPYPLYSKWFNEYHKLKPEIQINYQSIGSGGGIQQIKAKTVDFGASDAPLTAEEEKAMPAPIAQIPMTAGSVVVVYNLPGVDKGLKLTSEAVADLFLGKIKKWNDPKIASQNPGVNLPDMPVAVVHRSDGSGTTYVFTDYLAKANADSYWTIGRGKSVNWPEGIGAKGNEGVTGQVKQIPGAVGYVEYAYAIQNKLTYASIQNKAKKFIEPSPAATTAAASAMTGELLKDIRNSITDANGEGSYPISAVTYLLVYKTQEDGTKGKSLVDFLKWAMVDGQKMAESLQYSALPASLIQVNDKTISGIVVK